MFKLPLYVLFDSALVLIEKNFWHSTY